GVDAKRVAQRMVGYTDLSHHPTADSYRGLIAEESHDAHAQRGGQPYPFFLAHPLQEPLERFEALLGPPEDWWVERRCGGIRAQPVRRDGQSWVWSRGVELITDRFPERRALAEALPDGCVLDGEILAWRDPPGGSAAVFGILPLAL